jgi:cytoskeletal protein CcmA (bactofilin family)
MSVWRARRSEPALLLETEPTVTEPEPVPHVTPVTHEGGNDVANIGKSITIRGEVTGEEDLVIEGRVEGRIELVNHHLTVGTNGQIEAEVVAKEVTIVGHVSGNVTATERAEIQESGRLDGDLASPRLLIQEGAELNGSVSMKVPSVAKTKAPTASTTAPTPAPAAHATPA